MTTFKPAFVYFAIIFGAGFLLGTIRVLLLVPRIGERTAELIEIPFMLAIIFFTARFTVSKWGQSNRHAFTFGILAAAMMILAEMVLVIGFLGFTLSQYLENRDPVSGSVLAVSLVIFGLMPFLIFRFRRV